MGLVISTLLSNPVAQSNNQVATSDVVTLIVLPPMSRRVLSGKMESLVFQKARLLAVSASRAASWIAAMVPCTEVNSRHCFKLL